MIETHERRTPPGWARLRGSGPLAIVALMALIVPLLMTPAASVRWHGIKGLAFEVGVTLLLASIAWGLRDLDQVRRGLALARTGPNPFLIALAAWGLLSYALTPNKTFALHGLLQLAGGILVYFAAAAYIRTREHAELVTDALVGVTALVSLLGFATFGEGAQPVPGGVFDDHQLLGGFLMLMLPLMLMLSFAPSSPARRMAAQVAALLGGTCLLLAQTRSSWIAEAVALAALLALSWRFGAVGLGAPTTGARRRRALQYALPAVLVVCTLSLFVLLSGMGGTYARRAHSVTAAAAGHDESFESRRESWHGALAMIRARPLTGWGIGSYALYQKPFTHQGRGEAAILGAGPSLSEQAHDSYLQMTAELGVPGLLLWGGFLAAFLAAGWRALSRLPRGGLPQRLLMAAMAAVLGQAVDALANPAWQFSEVTLFFWIIAGVGAAAAAPARAAAPSASGRGAAAPPPARLRLAGFACLLGGVALLPYFVNSAWASPAPCYCQCTYVLSTSQSPPPAIASGGAYHLSTNGSGDPSIQLFLFESCCTNGKYTYTPVTVTSATYVSKYPKTDTTILGKVGSGIGSGTNNVQLKRGANANGTLTVYFQGGSLTIYIT